MSAPPPVYIIGRQHSGNTMLTSVLGRHPDVHAFLNEDRFFEHLRRFHTPPTHRDLSRLTDILADASLPPLPSEDRRRIQQLLTKEASQAGNGTSATVLYRKIKDQIAGKHGKRRWAQKATSYVFHAEDLLREIPRARLVFLVRNPLDIAASLRIRESATLWLRMCIGWRKGVREVRRLEREHPDRVLAVRYENVVRQPEQYVFEIFRFCDLTFDESVLSVNRINPAEHPYEVSGGQTGISDEKVGYYREHLTPREQSAVAWMTGRKLMRDEYPRVLDDLGRVTRPPLLAILRLTSLGLAHVAGDLTRRAVDDPGGTTRRFWQRLWR